MRKLCWEMVFPLCLLLKDCSVQVFYRVFLWMVRSRALVGDCCQLLESLEQAVFKFSALIMVELLGVLKA